MDIPIAAHCFVAKFRGCRPVVFHSIHGVIHMPTAGTAAHGAFAPIRNSARLAAKEIASPSPNCDHCCLAVNSDISRLHLLLQDDLDSAYGFGRLTIESGLTVRELQNDTLELARKVKAFDLF